MGAARGRRHRTLDERLKLYSTIKEMRADGLSAAQTAERTGASVEDVRYLLRHKPSRERYAPDLTPRPELAYLVGAYLGDGRTAGEKDKKVRFKVADVEFARQLNELVARVLGATPRPLSTERGFICVNYDSAVLYDFLQQSFNAFTELENHHPNMFLRGFFDAEGYASPVLNYAKQKFAGIVVGAANTNVDYLIRSQELLSSYGIKSTFRSTHEVGEEMTIRGRTFIRKHAVRHLVINTRNDVSLFHSVVGFAIPEKREKLADMLRIMDEMTGEDAYRWFVKNYHKANHKWIKVKTVDNNRE